MTGIMRTLMSRSLVVCWVIVVFLMLWCVIVLQYRLDARYPKLGLLQSFRYRDPVQLKRMIPRKYHSVSADLHWIRFIQFYFDNMDKPDKVKQVMDTITALDSHLPSVYYITAINFVAGSSRIPPQPEKALQVFNQGIEAVPTFWGFYPNKAILIALYDHDYPRAQAVLSQAMLKPGAPNYLGDKLIYLALRTKSYQLINQVLAWQEKNHPTEKEQARIRLNQQWLQSINDRRKLSAWALSVFRQTGRYPVNLWQYLRDEISLPGVSFISAKDPAGYAYHFNKKTGEITLDPFSPLFTIDRDYQSMYVSPKKIQELIERDKLRKIKGKIKSRRVD